MNGGLSWAIELSLALAGLLVMSPLMAVVAIATKLTSPGPILFRQIRVGRGGKPFELVKFRTMTMGEPTTAVTAGGDPRVTPFGRVLRRTKLDELPELWNVLRGEMALVGARPEVPRFVDLESEQWRAVLRDRPGLTHPVSILLRTEEDLLAEARSAGFSTDDFYREHLLRWKLNGYLEYQERRRWWTDVAVLMETALAIVIPSRVKAPLLDEILPGRQSGHGGRT